MRTKDKVSQALSEVRTLVTGAQILVGFQFQAVFRPAFDKLPPSAKVLEGAALALLLTTLACLLAPSSFHRIAEGGESTRRVLAYATLMMTAALVPFAAALGANVAIALSRGSGPVTAALVGAATAAVAALFWFGIPLMQRKTASDDAAGQADETVSLKEKVQELLMEARIVLPGAQALLGFQFAAYLTESFEALPPAAKVVHTVSLLLIALAVVLLMTPAPYHRIVEKGEATERFDRVGVGFVLAAMVPLALGLAGDVYVVVERLSGSVVLSVAGAAATAAGALGLWFGVPLAARRAAR